MKYQVQINIKLNIKARDEDEAAIFFFDDLRELYDNGELDKKLKIRIDDDDEDAGDDEELEDSEYN